VSVRGTDACRCKGPTIVGASPLTRVGAKRTRTDTHQACTNKYQACTDTPQARTYKR